MNAITVRPTTPDDVACLGGGLPWRIRATTVERDGEVMGFGGLGFMPDGTVCAFIRARAGATGLCRVTLHKAALRTLDMAHKAGIRRIVAVADPEIAPAERWLLRLGFQPIAVEGGKAFVWEPKELCRHE